MQFYFPGCTSMNLIPLWPLVGVSNWLPLIRGEYFGLWTRFSTLANLLLGMAPDDISRCESSCLLIWQVHEAFWFLLGDSSSTHPGCPLPPFENAGDRLNLLPICSII